MSEKEKFENTGTVEREAYRQGTVYQCRFCHTKTNLFEPVGFYGNPRVRCPVCRDAPSDLGVLVSADDFDERHLKHAALQRLMERREQLEERRQLYAGAQGATAADTVATLEAEYETLVSRITDLRAWFDGRFDDVTESDVAPESSVRTLDGSHAQVSEAALERVGIAVEDGLSGGEHR